MIKIKPSKVGSLHKHLGIDENKKIPLSKLKIKDSDSPSIKKKKQFALNARKFNHELGGYIESEINIARDGFNFENYFPMERDIPMDTISSYNRDIDKFAWRNTLQGDYNLKQLQSQQQLPQQIDSSYFLQKTPKGYSNVYDKSNRLIGYSMDNKTIVKQEPNFEDGGKAKPPFENFYKTINPDYNDTTTYNLREAYNNLPYNELKKWQQNPEKNHLPDTYKLPNHPTFSNESIYYKKGMPAGRWEGENYIPMDRNKNIEKGYEDGGMIKAWIQKFLGGGEAMGGNTYFNRLKTLSTNPDSNSVFNADQLYDTQNPPNNSFAPRVESNLTQPIGTGFYTNYNATDKQVRQDNKLASSMMGEDGSPLSKAVPILSSIGAAGDAVIQGGGAIASLVGDESAGRALQKAGEIGKVAESFGNIVPFPGVGKALGAVTSIFATPFTAWGEHIATVERAKGQDDADFHLRNSAIMQSNNPYGNQHSKYGGNIKNMQQRVIDDIYSDFDKYMKLT